MIELTPQEKAAVKAMKKKTTKRTAWGLKVFQTVRGGTNEDIRKLIVQLQSEGLANPACMDAILGGGGTFDLVMQCDYEEHEVSEMIQQSGAVTIFS